MVARGRFTGPGRGLGVITAANFFVPQVNTGGSMASFIAPAAIPRQSVVAAAANAKRGLGRYARGLGVLPGTILYGSVIATGAGDNGRLQPDFGLAGHWRMLEVFALNMGRSTASGLRDIASAASRSAGGSAERRTSRQLDAGHSSRANRGKPAGGEHEFFPDRKFQPHTPAHYTARLHGSMDALY